MLAPSIRIAGGGLRFPGDPCRTELGVQFVALFKFPVGLIGCKLDPSPSAARGHGALLS